MLRKRTVAVLTGATVVMALVPWRAEADQVINDDLIVDGSACIGFDCVNGESFGFDTLRLKENNLRIRFDDTSTSASFPNTDWQLAANETTNGGLHAFYIEDLSNGRRPFVVEAAAPSNSLYVDDAGRIGLGTNVPVVELHVIDGDTPTLRLQQDGSSGFTPQTWDVAGNETNFFIRDATNGSTLPFRIRPSAPSSAVDIHADGVGIFNSNPDSDLEVSDGPDAGSVARVRISSGGAEWEVGLSGAGELVVSLVGSGNNELRIEQDGDMFVRGDLTVSGGDLTVVAGGGGCTGC